MALMWTGSIEFHCLLNRLLALIKIGDGSGAIAS